MPLRPRAAGVTAATVVALAVAVVGAVAGCGRHAAPAPTPRGSATPTPSGGLGAPAGGRPPMAFSPATVDFLGDELGFAYGSAPCLERGTTLCPALLRTTNGGRNWAALVPPPLLDLGDRVHHPLLRFADALDGIATDGHPGSPLALTHDGGRSWALTPLPHAPADAAVTALGSDADRFVLVAGDTREQRVYGGPAGAVPAPVGPVLPGVAASPALSGRAGSTSPGTATDPSPSGTAASPATSGSAGSPTSGTATGPSPSGTAAADPVSPGTGAVSLTLSGTAAWVAVSPRAGTPTLLRTADGTTWARAALPCTAGQTATLSSAGPLVVYAICQTVRTATTAARTLYISADGGRSFVPSGGAGGVGLLAGFAAASSSVFALATTGAEDELLRSGDGGRSLVLTYASSAAGAGQGWYDLTLDSSRFGAVVLGNIGTYATAVAGGGKDVPNTRLLLTADGGAHWSQAIFAP